MKHKTFISILLAVAIIGCPVAARDNPKVLVIRAGKIWTVAKDVINDGIIIIENGKIRAVGKNLTVPDKVTLLEMPQSSVIPGLIDAHSHLALSPSPLAEMDETVSAVTADTHILDAFDPLCEDIQKAVLGGVTTALIAPGNRNPIAGQTAIVKLHPGPTEQWLLRREAGLKLSVTNETLQRDRKPTSRPGMIALIREQLDKGKQYNSEVFNPQAEVLNLLVERKLPVFITARTPDEVVAALDIIRDYNLAARLVAARQADEVAEEIAKQKIPVIYSSMLDVSKDKDLKRPGRLGAAGVKIAFASHAPQTSPVDLRTSAVIAAKYGLEPELALKSITLHAAEILGVAHRVGSIQEGKDADLVILNGDPLELTSVIQVVIINGDIVYQREGK